MSERDNSLGKVASQLWLGYEEAGKLRVTRPYVHICTVMPPTKGQIRCEVASDIVLHVPNACGRGKIYLEV